ncbi:MAG: carbamate kinase [Candidatus Diapherotrites archaeon]|nr:carbamate kinase [Candidatus Diapherotrites archaeon]
MQPHIVGLGGNALIRMHQLGDFTQQLKNVQRTCRALATYAGKGNPLVITHGNGPQVGNLELQMRAASPNVPQMPLDVEGAMTQGQIGHLLFLGLKKWKPTLEISMILTHVEVDPKDYAFKIPTKPIGPWYSHSTHLTRHRIPFLHDPKKGFRRLVASPNPQKIIELDAIRTLLKQGHVVIAGGGGGIPVFRNKMGYRGAEGVIDKDLASSLLATRLKAHQLTILTDESHVYTQFATRHPRPILHMNRREARAHLRKGEFGEGSMRPKIEAGLRFLQKGGRVVHIGHTDDAKQVMMGEKGTRIYP